MENSVKNTLSHNNRTIYATPTTRIRGRQQFSLDISSATVNENEPVNALTELLHQTWHIFGVSILFNFYQDEVRLKQYAKRLREEISNTLNQEDVTYDTNFIIEDIRRPSPLDPSPIKIEVYSKNENNVERCIYKGILLSWRTELNELTTVNSVRLPLLLCRGAERCMKIVHNVLSCMFDCMVIPLFVQEDDLMWLVPIVIAPTNEKEHPKGTDEICMEYRIPELPVTDTITVKFQVVDLIKILTILIKNERKDASVEMSLNLEHVEKFHEVLRAQMLKASGVQLGSCILHRISLPAVTVMENRMKVFKQDTMNRVLSYLNKKALDALHVLNFKI